MRYSLIVLLLLSSSLGLGACKRSYTPPHVDTAPSSDPKDAELLEKVQTFVAKDPSLSPQAHAISVFTKNGMVTLRGTVRDDKERDAIGERIQAFPGVASVNNELTFP